MADRTRTLLSDDELFSLVKQADPLAKRIPPGVRAIADAIYTAAVRDDDELRKDAERYAKLKPRLIAAYFAYQDMNETVLVFSWPSETPVSANLDAMLDSTEVPQ